MPWYKDNNKILPDGGRLYVGTTPLELKGVSATFPFSLINSSTNTGNNAIRLQFNSPSTVTFDYGDDIVKTYNTYDYGAETNVIYITGNLYYTDLLTYCPIHYYSGGTVANRTVKISYNRGTLLSFATVSNMGFITQPFNFKWSSHPVLTTFSTTLVDWVSDIDINGLTSSTNPLLKSLSLTFFNSTSVYYNELPLNILNIPLETFAVGTNGFGTSTLAATKLDQIAVYPVKNSLKFLFLAPTAMTDAQGLPTNWTTSNLPLLTYLSLEGSNRTYIPNISGLTGLTSLRVLRNQNMTSYGDISALVNLITLDWNSTPQLGLPSTYPTYFNSFTKLRNLLYSNCGQQVATTTARIVNSVYDLITRNAPLTGVDNGTIPYRGMTIDLRVSSGISAITGTIQAPSGFILGSNNGTPANTGEQIYVLTNQYGTTILIST